MHLKIFLVLASVLLIWLIFFHRSLPRLSKKLGRRVGEVKDAGAEIMDDRERPGSPLARYESQVGRAVATSLVEQFPLCADARLQERVNRVGQRLAAHARRREIEFRFAALECNDPDAWSVPGGSVFISTGLLRQIGGDDNRLAGVLGHEIAHIDCRHAIKASAARAAANATLQVLSFGRSALLRHLSGFAGKLVADGYSDERELEADRHGAELARQGDYLPAGLASFLEDIAEDHPGGARLPPFFNKHPPLPRRIAQLKKRWG